jgi:hypothetical protein
MADARIVSPRESPNTVYALEGNAGSLGPARILPYTRDEDDNEDQDGVDLIPTPIPVPSAPHESLFMTSLHKSPHRATLGHQARLGAPTKSPHSPPNAYAPYSMYNHRQQQHRFDSRADRSVAESTMESSYQQEPFCNRIESYSYDENTAMSELTDHAGPQLGHAQLPLLQTSSEENVPSESSLNVLFNRLLRELRGSIHDYEVISCKTVYPEYRELFTSLSPTRLGEIIATVSMSYQVQVAVLLARQISYNSNFTCAHCKEAVNKASDYFKTNMVEALIPYVHDLDKNRQKIEEELTDWERCVTERCFEKYSS